MVVNKISEIIRFIWLHLLMLSLVCMNCQFVYADSTAVTSGSSVIGPNMHRSKAASNLAPNIATGGITPDSSIIGNKVYMDKAANGIPVVNINNPNSSGISHNRFTDYNVGNRGAVINNSRDIAVSKLGGVVLGNANLQQSARAIINEVTGTGRSHINGTQEILGARADYILANPNGISVNGGEFINAHRAMLTTGRVILDSSGNLEKLLVEKGDVEIFGKELDISNLDYFDIIARTTKINSRIHAGRQARIITGKGEFNDREQSFKSSESSVVAPDISIDSSHLGGLYAGRISIIGNEDGVGVNLPDMASSSGDIEITGSGRIVHKNISSVGNLSIRSGNSSIKSTANTRVAAKTDITYQAQDGIEVADGAIINAAGGVNIKSNTGMIVNKGRIVSEGNTGLDIITESLENSGDLYAANGNLDINASGDISNTSNIIGKKAVRVSVGGRFENRSKVTSFCAFFITGTGSFENARGASLQSKGNFHGRLSGAMDNSGKMIIAGGMDLGTDAGFKNVGKLRADYVDITGTDGILNSGEIVSRGRVKLASLADIYNSKLIRAKKLEISASDGVLRNSGVIDSATITDISVRGGFENRAGQLVSEGEISINAGNNMSSDNRSVIVSKQGGIRFDVAGTVDNAGQIKSALDVIGTSSESIINRGSIVAGRVLDFGAKSGIENAVTGNLDAYGAVRLESGLNLENHGRILSERGAVTFAIASNITNTGQVESALDIIGTSSSIINKGSIVAGRVLDLRTLHGIENTADASLESVSSLILKSNAGLSNHGLIFSGDNIDLAFDGNVNNTGEIESIGNLLVISNMGQITNAGDIIAGGTSSYLAAGHFTNAGKIASDLKLTISSDGEVTNKGLIIGEDVLELTGKSGFVNNGGMGAGKELVINSGGTLINTGLILGHDVTTLQATMDIENIDAGKIEAHGDLTITSKTGKVTSINNDPATYEDSGIITFTKLVIRSALGIGNIDSHIESGGDMQIAGSGSFDNHGGIVLAGGELVLLINGTVNNTAIMQAGSNILLRGLQPETVAGRLTNSGLISSASELDLKSEGDTQNSGIIQGKEAVKLTVNAGSFVNAGVVLSQLQDIETVSEGDITVSSTGVFDAAKSVTLTSSKGQIANSGKIFSADAGVTMHAESDIGNYGTIVARDDVIITSDRGAAENRSGKASIVSLGSNVIINADGEIVSSGLLQAKELLGISSRTGSFHNDGGNVIAGGGVKIEAVDIVNNRDADSSDGSGYIQAGNLLELIAIGRIENVGVINSLDAGTITAESDIINSGNVQINRGSLVSGSGGIINTHLIASGSDLQLTAAKDIINTGDMDVADLTLSSATRIENRGQIKAVKFTVADTPILENSGLIEFGQMLATAKLVNVDNKEGAMLRGGDLTLKAGNFTNAGQTRLSGALNLDVDNMTSNILVAEGNSDIRISDDFINTGRLHVAGADLTLTAKSVTNRGEFKVGRFNATTTEGVFNNQGMVFASGAIDIDAPEGITNTGNSSYIISGGTTALKTGKALTNGKGIYGASGVTVSAATINNSGVINSPGLVAITAGSTTNSGILAGRNSLALSGSLTNSGTLVSNSSLAVNAGNGSIYNTGYITSHGNASLGSSTLSNYGTLQAVGTLTGTQSGSITNASSIYGGIISLRAGGSVTNNARIIANSGLAIIAGGDVSNRQEISLLGAGTLSVTARNIYNDRKYVVARINRSNIAAYQPLSTVSERGEQVNLGDYHNQHLVTLITEKAVYRDKLSSIENLSPVMSSGGDISFVVSSKLDNSAGKILARRNISVSGSALQNEDIITLEHTHHKPTKEIYAKQRKWDFWGEGSWTEWGPSYEPQAPFFTESVIQRIPSLIQAGGSITGTLAGSVTNGSEASGGGRHVVLPQSPLGKPGAGNYAVGSSAPVDVQASDAAYKARFKTIASQELNTDQPALSKLAVAATRPVKPSAIQLSLQRSKAKDRSARIAPKLARVSIEIVDLGKLAQDLAKTYETPSGVHKSPDPDVSWEFDDVEIMEALRSSNWNKPAAPGHYYITETSPVFTDVEKYFSTDNFIKRIEGFEPKKKYMHYGDSMKQMDLVRRQMIDLTGFGSLDDNLDSIQQMQKLYETGIRYGKELRLSAGVALTKEQVDQLQDDMVWAEEIILDGSKVIIPKLYVAKNKRSQQAGGMLAQTIDIKAGSISNTSSITGNVVSLTARDGDIVNSEGGEIYASEHLRLSSAGNITNIGSTIVSDGSGVMLAGGNIENITESEQYGDSGSYFTTVGPKASIKIASTLTMKSLGDLVNHGASIESGDLHFEVGGNLQNVSVVEASGMENSGDNHHYRQHSTRYRPGTITAAGNITGLVSGDFSLIGSRMSSEGDSAIAVGGNSHLISQIASESVDSHSSSKSTNAIGATSKSSYSHQSLTETLVASSLSAGGRNVLINGRDQVLYGARIHGGKGVRLKGRKTSILASRLNNYSSTNSYDKGMVLEETESFGHDSTSHVHSALSTDGDNGSQVKVESELVSVDYTREKSGGFFSPGTATEHKPAWARQLESDTQTQVSWNPLQDSSESWYESDTRLTPEASMVVSMAAAIGTSWMGGWGMFAEQGASFTTVMQQAAITGLASRSSVAMANNGFNIFDAGAEVLSPSSIKSMTVDVATAGLVSRISDIAKLKSLQPGMELGDRAGILTQHGLVSAGVRTGLAGISGEKPVSVIKGELQSGVLALSQSMVGDFAAEKGENNRPFLENGSVGKVALHAATGGIYSAATGGDVTAGIIGGAVSEIVPSLMESANGNTGPPTPGAIKATTQLVAATASMIAGGDAQDINTASKVALSSIEHNLDLHNLGHEFFWSDEMRQEMGQQGAESIKDSVVFVKENPIEAAVYAVDAATLLLVPELAASTLLLKRMAAETAKTTITTGIKQAAKTGVTKVATPVKKQMTSSQLKSIRSLQKQIQKHESKLQAFKDNPTIRPGMKNLPKSVIVRQQQTRIKHLEKEINTFKNNIKKIRNDR